MNETQKTKAPSAPSPFFNSARAVAQYLGCDPVTVRRLMRKRALPYIRLGGHYLFRKSEVEDVLERRTIRATGASRGRKATEGGAA